MFVLVLHPLMAIIWLQMAVLELSRDAFIRRDDVICDGKSSVGATFPIIRIRLIRWDACIMRLQDLAALFRSLLGRFAICCRF